ncbi:MAG: hypothetical protein ABI237_18160 [Ginsengibacter sp.]
MDTRKIDRALWTENDFEEMNWHDNKIYAISFLKEENQISFDIDYILEWIEQKKKKSCFKFLIVPATLVFRNVYEFSMSLSLVDITIDSIYRNNPTKPKNAAHIVDQIEYDWVIETTNGEIVFKSVGYKQYARQKPRLNENQSIGFFERGGISFDKVGF